MRLRFHDLQPLLRKQLHPVYLISGDEPLQVLEACDQVRAAARAAGCELREVLEVNNEQFNWRELANLAASPSLFGDRRLLELRLPSAKPGREGSDAICEYLQHATADGDILLIIAGKLDKAGSSARWCKAIEQHGVLLQAWPIGPAELESWLQQRAKSRGLALDRDALTLLAERVEGNLLAAAQELDKLALLSEGQSIDREAVLSAVADSARYDAFQAVDTLLAGRASSGLRMLQGLRAEGNEVLGVLWALSRDVRALHDAWLAQRDGMPARTALRNAGVWDKRIPLLEQTLQRHRGATVSAMMRSCALCDRAAKGAAMGDAWNHLYDLALLLADGKTLPLGLSAEL
jgi:DNA polymerase III subunit delta